MNETNNIPWGELLRVIIPGLLLVTIGHLVNQRSPIRLFRNRLSVVISAIRREMLSVNLVVFLIGIDAIAIFSTSQLPMSAPIIVLQEKLGVDVGVCVACCILLHIVLLLSIQSVVGSIFEKDLLHSERVFRNSGEMAYFVSDHECISFLTNLFSGLDRIRKAGIRLITLFILFLSLWLYLGPTWVN